MIDLLVARSIVNSVRVVDTVHFFIWSITEMPPSKKSRKQRPRTKQRALCGCCGEGHHKVDIKALLPDAHKFFREKNMYVKKFVEMEDGWKRWSNEDFLFCAKRHELQRKFSRTSGPTRKQVINGCGPQLTNQALQTAMTMAYIYLMLDCRAKSEDFYRQALFVSVPTDAGDGHPCPGWGEQNYLTSKMFFKLVKHYDILLCNEDGRQPCERMLKKYSKLFVKLSVGAVDFLDYPILAELPKSECP